MSCITINRGQHWTGAIAVIWGELKAHGILEVMASRLVPPFSMPSGGFDPLTG